MSEIMISKFRNPSRTKHFFKVFREIFRVHPDKRTAFDIVKFSDHKFRHDNVSVAALCLGSFFDDATTSPDFRLSDPYGVPLDILFRQPEDFSTPETSKRCEKHCFFQFSSPDMADQIRDVLIGWNITLIGLCGRQSGMEVHIWQIHPHDRCKQPVGILYGLRR